jgi:hypothetical protein
MFQKMPLNNHPTMSLNGGYQHAVIAGFFYDVLNSFKAPYEKH